MKFPEWFEAPEQLLNIDGHCGLFAAWLVLRHFKKRISIAKLVKACGYTKRHGVFTVALASCLQEHGLLVSFHSDPDTNIGRFERTRYARAHRAGIVTQPALDLTSLLRERKRGRIPIVLFNTPSDEGHFSPLLGCHDGIVRLPLAEGGSMTTRDFEAARIEPFINRQCVIAGR